MSASLHSVATVIAHTPVWVWGLYALLLVLGLRRTRDVTLPLWRVLILPAVVTVLAVSSVIGAGLGTMPVILVGLAAGGAAGWRLEPAGAIRRLPGGRLRLRGEWWTLVQLALVLVLRYLTNVVAAIDPVLHANPAWQLGTLFATAALSGLFLGRTAARLRVCFAPALPSTSA
ncbi:hypothetical protein [Devosia sp.]|uniref:hypothetical protein n=1 Tax=Devosia sp. TaxID=1871048 RepID=UPI0035B204D7